MAIKLDALPARDRPARRFGQLLVGLLLFGTSIAMMIRATLGLNPWTCCTRASRCTPR